MRSAIQILRLKKEESYQLNKLFDVNTFNLKFCACEKNLYFPIMPAGSKPMPAAQPATSPTCYTSPIGHVLAAEGRISLQVEKTKRGMCGGWVEHTEECMDDGSNIQRNVWRMGRKYRGMYGG